MRSWDSEWNRFLAGIRACGSYESGIMFSYNGVHRYYANGQWQENPPADYVYLKSPMLTPFDLPVAQSKFSKES